MRHICGVGQLNTNMVESSPLAGLPDVLELRPRKLGDDRGFFSEVWRREWLSRDGDPIDFVQDNHSFSRARGVLRGMHFQLGRAAQHKLVRVSRGSVFDVALDLRTGSPTFGKWAGLVLSAEYWNQLFIPVGFAHGFVTLEANTEVIYKVSASYSPADERAIRYNDPDIGIEWPVAPEDIIVSDKDKQAPRLRELGPVF
jgi:dTDP-4-dehydrorhamnose 3,5-epimerase